MADDTGGTWNSTGDSIGGISGGDLASGAQGLIGAAGSLFGGQQKAEGYTQEANLYDQAATLEGWNQTYAQESGDIQNVLATRQYNTVREKTIAQTAANGFQTAGSTAAINREAWNTFGITKGQINLQTGINEAKFEEQKIGYEAQATGARSAAAAASSGGIMGALGSVVGILGKFI